ncbi:MAG: porin family protein, partial [Bacteroidetes bacterium]|nr:porin family protein [Bacteroidota bacterium]
LDPDIESFNRGLLVGYNFQTSSLVYGIEADYGFVNANEGPNINLYGNDWTKFEFKRNAHVRARIGYADNNFLIYAAGGLAIADFTIDDTDPGWGEDDVSPVGWTIGAGIEYMITKKLIIRFEYLYNDYCSENFNIPWNGEPDYYGDVSLTADIFRAALSFKF